MTAIKLATPSVELVERNASDFRVIQAMLVSTRGGEELTEEDRRDSSIEGRINFLMQNRHGTPFEHTFFKFRVYAPIAVYREHHRHRIGWSYNEESGRYRQLEPEFYMPPRNRPLVQTGKPGAYEMGPGNLAQHEMMETILKNSFERAYEDYLVLMGMGIAKEVARGVLPVYIMSSMYATCNARSLMAFLSLRTDEPSSYFPSKPMWEIDQFVARQYEQAFKDSMPITYKMFNRHGRVAP